MFPNYGSCKGQPLAGATLRNLNWYADNCRKAIADPGKAKWAAKEQEMLTAIEAEIAAQTGGTQPHDNDEPPPHSDSDAF